MLNLFEEFFAITGAFEKHGIRYAVIGGFAMAFHDSVRATRDIDFLVLLEDINDIATVIEELGYRPTGAPFTFQDTRLTLQGLQRNRSAGRCDGCRNGTGACSTERRSDLP